MKSKSPTATSPHIVKTAAHYAQLAEVGSVRLRRITTNINGQECVTFVVTAFLYIDGEDMSYGWTYMSFAEACNRFLESVILDLADQFLTLRNGDYPDFASPIAGELFMKHAAEIGVFRALEELGTVTSKWEQHILAEWLRADGRADEANGIEAELKQASA